MKFLIADGMPHPIRVFDRIARVLKPVQALVAAIHDVDLAVFVDIDADDIMIAGEIAIGDLLPI